MSGQQSERAFLQSYDPSRYERPSLAVDMVLFTVMQSPEDNYRRLPPKHLYLLLVQRGGHPFKGQWALPGGFVQPAETAGTAARRELAEETGLSGVYLEQLYTFTDPGRDPRTRVVSCAHMALVDGERLKRPEAGSDAARAAWFRLEAQPVSGTREVGAAGCRIDQRLRLLLSGPQGESLGAEVTASRRREGEEAREEIAATGQGLAFDHAAIIATALLRLRGKLDYTDVALHLMPDTFTLTELQQVYEVILGRPLLKAAFRRKVAPLVEGTEQYRSSAGHRPSQLYRRNWNGIADLLG